MSLKEALEAGNPKEVERMIAAGADILFRDENGYDALSCAVHGRDIEQDPHLLELLELLVKNGVDLNGETIYKESGLRVLSRIGRFDAVRLLLQAGADPAPLGWTPLIEAVALGTPEECADLLSLRAPLEERDWWERTPWLFAIQVGDLAKAQMLKDAGVDIDAYGRCGKPPLFYAIESHRAPMLRWLLDTGQDPEQTDQFGTSALVTAAEQDDRECLAILLEAGVEVDRKNDGSTALGSARSREIALRLLEAGADPAQLKNEARRSLLGFPADPSDLPLEGLSKAHFLKSRTRRFGRSNPEEMREPFWEAMVRSGVSGYVANETFGGPSSFDAGPVWCAQRFGQSLTILPDGRTILIGGEHEDFYDSDFCIYNDVIVHAADGSLRIYGYPESIFPPTDFHSATLLDDKLYLIGSLGYASARSTQTPVYCLDTVSLRIEKVETGGDSPGWIFGHRAIPVSKQEIRIQGGTLIAFAEGKETQTKNRRSYLLEVKTGQWRSA